MNDEDLKCVPIAWASRKSKRVARSTLTAETLGAVDGVDSAHMIKKSIEEMLQLHLPPINLYVDNKSLFDAIKTSNVLADKRLMVDISALRQMADKKEITVHWIKSELQLADALTKAGASKHKLMDVVSSGIVHL